MSNLLQQSLIANRDLLAVDLLRHYPRAEGEWVVERDCTTAICVVPESNDLYLRIEVPLQYWSTGCDRYNPEEYFASLMAAYPDYRFSFDFDIVEIDGRYQWRLTCIVVPR